MSLTFLCRAFSEIFVSFVVIVILLKLPQCKGSIAYYEFYHEKLLQGMITLCTHPCWIDLTSLQSPLHMDWVILQFCRRASPKELFAPKETQTLNLMEMLQRPRLLPLETTTRG